MPLAAHIRRIAAALAAMTIAACGESPSTAPLPQPAGAEPHIALAWQVQPSPAAREAAEAAARRWAATLEPFATAADAPRPVSAGECGANAATTVGRADVTILVLPLPRGLPHVADAWPCVVRSDGTTRVGVIRIALDRLDDAAPMTADDLFAHEIGHALGLGSGWFTRGVTNPDGRFPSSSDHDVRFTGAEARAAAGALGVPGAQVGIPIARTDPAFGHWDPSLAGELMAWAAVPDMRLSRITLGALADLGYAVRPDRAEPFTPSPALSFATRAQVSHGSNMRAQAACGGHASP